MSFLDKVIDAIILPKRPEKALSEEEFFSTIASLKARPIIVAKEHFATMRMLEDTVNIYRVKKNLIESIVKLRIKEDYLNKFILSDEKENDVSPGGCYRSLLGFQNYTWANLGDKFTV